MPSGVERRQVLRGAVWAAPAIAVCASAAAVNTSQLNPVYSGYSWNQGAPANIPNGYDSRKERDARINADQTYYFGFYNNGSDGNEEFSPVGWPNVDGSTYPSNDTGLASPNAGTPANLTGLYQVFWINTAEYSNVDWQPVTGNTDGINWPTTSLNFASWSKPEAKTLAGLLADSRFNEHAKAVQAKLGADISNWTPYVSTFSGTWRYEKNDLRAKTNAHFAAVLHVHSNNTPLTSLPIVMGAVVTMREIGSQNAITNANNSPVLNHIPLAGVVRAGGH